MSQLFFETLAYLLSWGLRHKQTVSGDKFNLFKVNLRLSWKSFTCISLIGLPCQSVNQMHVCLGNNINGWLINNRNAFLLVLEFGSLRSGCQDGRFWEGLLPGCRLSFSYIPIWQKRQESSLASLIWGLILFMSTSPS